jgi:hypothetical protein
LEYRGVERFSGKPAFFGLGMRIANTGFGNLLMNGILGAHGWLLTERCRAGILGALLFRGERDLVKIDRHEPTY